MTENSNIIESKRTDYIDWDEYFMAVAFLAAKRSKDPSTQVGACIINDEKKIVGVGYNGMPIGCNDDDFPWSRNSSDRSETKYLYVCHAELNAVLNKNSSSVKNCTIYVALFPCNECAKVIIQSGIKTVVYMSDKHAKKKKTIAAKKMFNAAGVEYRKYTPKNNKIVIDFEEINWNDMTQLPPTPVKSDETPQLLSTPVKKQKSNE
ncbi:deoxycytidylate deaminase [Lasioglossum baleicum]|uniref:deoxycytidylate deaminase n=1 Tax=Lasioglossum baleicum TaxID=434251 RepID=UPI003FCD51D9